MGKLFDKIRRVQDKTRPFCSAIVPAAGSSARMGGQDKLLTDLCGAPVLMRTLCAIDRTELVDEIIVATREELLLTVADLCGRCGLHKPVKVVRGGSTRAQSVLAAALEANPKAGLLAVHDAARPLVDPAEFDEIIRLACRTNAAAPAVPVTDTIKAADPTDGRVLSPPDRSTLFAVYTPQVIEASLLKAALQSAIDAGAEITDDCSAVERLGKESLPGHGQPGKYQDHHPPGPADRRGHPPGAGQMTNLRMGHGYDVHRLTAGRPLILGGVHVPYDRGLDGHSDADVLTHAVMDALLGAAALGDIGRLFPDSDDAFLNISSLVLLSRVRDALANAGYRVVNIDATLIAQAPKVGPYRRQMQENLAAALAIGPGCVNVKATTEEHLGFTGDGSGMSAHAVALIEHI